MNFRHDQQILCCGATIWAKLIAIIQIIFYIVALVMSILLLYHLKPVVDEYHQGSGHSYSKDEKKTIDGIALAIVIIAIIASIIGILMGIILIIGVTKKRTDFLTTWIVLAVVDTVYRIVNLIRQRDIETVLTSILGLIILTFGIWVVTVVRRQIIEQRLERFEETETIHNVHHIPYNPQN